MIEALPFEGRKFGRLTVLSAAKKGYWSCACTCGGHNIVSRRNLVGGGVKSCGCLHRENVLTVNITHGYARKKEYRAWSHAKERCYSPKDKKYPLYGGRGIRMCAEWRYDFSKFIADMGPCPKGFTLERKNTNGDYEKGNCTWADRLTQANNTRFNVLVECEGVLVTLAQLARKKGLNYKSLQYFRTTLKLPLDLAIRRATKL